MNSKDIRKKIGTVENVKKITNAMQMVSAVKMKKAQKIALEGRLYRTMLDQILQRILRNSSETMSLNIPWLTESEGTKELYILIASNKGLCGSFHTNLFKHIFSHLNASSADEFITIGKKGADFVSLTKRSILADFSDQDLSDSVSPVFSLIEEKFLSGEYKAIYIVYNKFISSLKSEPTIAQLLPVKDVTPLENLSEGEKKQTETQDYLIEPSVEELLGPLVEDYVKEKIRSALADSEASEHSARMLAMKNATDSAGEIVHSLTLLRNKIRQSQITNELLDMIAAKESTDAN
ncbi:MAG: ATP synthase F1 subunit gamma [Candidatus Moraniibacteriota bacterium]|nr:MAG: ATP synthase F1 subunit gamma [Candidatus Moranbacteria bacterium]